jgi:hypothetical protein
VIGFEQLQAGDHSAAQKLWQRYFHRLVQVAKEKLQATPLRTADEEDVALSAFDSFCRAAEHGRVPRLHDRDDLWRLLLTITSRKASRRVRDERRQKRRGGNAVPSDADLKRIDFDRILG